MSKETTLNILKEHKALLDNSLCEVEDSEYDNLRKATAWVKNQKKVDCEQKNYQECAHWQAQDSGCLHCNIREWKAG